MIPGPVLRAFGLDVDVTLRPIGRAFVAEHLVLKQVEDETEAAWCAETLARLRPTGVRIARPLRTAAGDWVVDGWMASERIGGRTGTRWPEIIEAGRAFHRATAALERPALLDARTHLWARADRLAWGDERPEKTPSLIAALLDRVRPLDLPAQIVHGDLTANVLFASGLDPAVIDFSPYWRPPGWALAVVVVDAIVWHRAPFDLVDALDADQRGQLLARATLFRLFSGEPEGPHERWVRHLCQELDDAT